MNKHILKLIWNRRKDYIWIFAEQILVFVILFYCITEVYIKLEQYLYPGNLNVENIASLDILPNRMEINTEEEKTDFLEKYKHIMDKMENSPYVEVVHKGYYTIPGNRPSSNNRRDSLTYRGNKYPFYIKTSDGNFQKIFRVKMLEGTWYKDEVLADGTYPAILTNSLVKEMGLDNPVGTKFNYSGRDFTVTGIMNDYKSFLYDDIMPSALLANSAFDENDEHVMSRMEKAMLIKEGQMSEFVNYFWREAQRTFPNSGHQFFIYDLGFSRDGEQLEVTSTLLFLGVVPTIFLTIFAFLGTFSLMYRITKKNFGEYGLRMALGSTRRNLKGLILRQTFLLISIAAFIGCLIAFNIYIFVFPEAGIPIIVGSIVSALLSMFLFSFISVWYPAYTASKIQPAIALKQEE